MSMVTTLDRILRQRDRLQDDNDRLLRVLERIVAINSSIAENHPPLPGHCITCIAREALNPKRAYYETHEPPHCPTCDCRLRDALTRPPFVKQSIDEILNAEIARLKAQIAAMQRGGDCK